MPTDKPSKTVSSTRLLLISGAFGVLAALQGCTVIAIAIADTVATVAVKTVGLAADAAIGAVKLTGQAVGAILPGDE